MAWFYIGESGIINLDLMTRLEIEDGDFYAYFDRGQRVELDHQAGEELFDRLFRRALEGKEADEFYGKMEPYRPAHLPARSDRPRPSSAASDRTPETQG